MAVADTAAEPEAADLSSCASGQSSDHSALRTALMKLIERRQRPADCRAAKTLVYVPVQFTSGLGSQVRMIAHSMLFALLLNRTFVVDTAQSVYVHPARCPSRRYDCLFQPMSSCSLADALAGTSSTVVEELPRVTFPSALLPSATEASSRVVRGRSSCLRVEPLHMDALLAELVAVDGAPSGSDQAPPPLEWWVQQVAGYVARPSARVQGFAQAFSRGMPAGDEDAAAPHHLGIHVRRGDKSVEAAVHANEPYVDAIARAAERVNATVAFLASDDREPFNAFPQAMPALQFSWVPHSRFELPPKHDRSVAAKLMERKYSVEAVQAEAELQDAKRLRRLEEEGDEGEVLAAQLVVLSQSAALVGTLTSNYLLLAYEMALHARHRDGAPPAPLLFDLDGNDYFACSVKDAPPWGPAKGRGGRK